ncbi:MAG: ABC transporter ATP-binding protein [Actinomycetota bacterium]|nr:ABC transporter ATP-binding protein [Actinomycetota bacterium]
MPAEPRDAPTGPTAAPVAAEVEPAGLAASCTGVVKIYWTATGEVNALKGVDASFPRAAVTAVVGPSGSGKSSLLRILAALDRPTAGQVRVGDVELSGLSFGRLRKVRRRLIGYVFQRPADNLIPYLTASQHLALVARLRGRRGAAGADELLEFLGIADRRHHLPHQLSGGEQQRLAFAQAVVGGPPIVVADEPTAELDSASGEALLQLVGGLARMGTSFVVATHDHAVVRQADRTLYLRHGAMEGEAGAERMLSVIDAAGRIQLPPEALRLFPDRRAVIALEEDHVRITPP